MKKIALIGSTGSIGRQVVSVVLRYPERFQIVAMAANAMLRCSPNKSRACAPHLPF